MITNYTFNTTSSNNTNKNKTITINNSSSFLGEPNYSKILDDLIADNIIENSPYLAGCLGKNTTPITTKCIKIEMPLKKKSNAFLDIFNGLFTKFIPSTDIKFEKGYTIKYNGHLITFYDDEIIIDDELFTLDEFFSDAFFKALEPTTKKTIISIYAKAGKKINISIAA